MIEQLHENQANITDPVDVLSEAVSNKDSTRGLESLLSYQSSQLDPIEEGAAGGLKEELQFRGL